MNPRIKETVIQRLRSMRCAEEARRLAREKEEEHPFLLGYRGYQFFERAQLDPGLVFAMDLARGAYPPEERRVFDTVPPKNFFKVYRGPGYPTDPQKELERSGPAWIVPHLPFFG